MKFRLREVGHLDLENLYFLAGQNNFLNLPCERKVLSNMIEQSIVSFQRKNLEFCPDDHFIFVLEDLELGKVIGTSAIHAQHGTPKLPHVFLKLGEEKKYSSSLSIKKTIKYLELAYTDNGPSEIGGLVLDPAYRGNCQKLGKQLSFVRFLFIALYPHKFCEKLHSELLPILEQDGGSSFWKSFGQTFVDLDYHQADLLSHETREFYLSLFPKFPVYTDLLSPEAQMVIGEVGMTARPVKRMLESIGFKYRNEIDPFDGGPHFTCNQKDVTLIQEFSSLKISDIKMTDKFILSHIPGKKFSAGIIELSEKSFYKNRSILDCLENERLSFIPFSLS